MSAIAPAPTLRLSAPRRVLRLRSDAALVDRYRAGDEAAFAVLYTRHRATVLAVCMGVLGSRHDAEDAAQETFASLALALRGEAPREMRSWLARVARNASIDVARRKRYRTCADGELTEPAAMPVPEDELQAVLAGIRELPESQRTALLMRELAGHTYLEIAALLGTDEDGVRGLIARARIGLRNYREASELPCASARAAVAAETDRRRLDKTARRHIRSCAACRAYHEALRSDARALRSLGPLQGGGALGGGAVAGLAAKGALLGAAGTQIGAACAVSVCAFGGLVIFYTHAHAHPARHAAPVAARSASAHFGAGTGTRPGAAAARAVAAPLPGFSHLSGQAAVGSGGSSAPASQAAGRTRSARGSGGRPSSGFAQGQSGGDSAGQGSGSGAAWGGAGGGSDGGYGRAEGHRPSWAPPGGGSDGSGGDGAGPGRGSGSDAGHGSGSDAGQGSGADAGHGSGSDAGPGSGADAGHGGDSATGPSGNRGGPGSGHSPEHGPGEVSSSPVSAGSGPASASNTSVSAASGTSPDPSSHPSSAPGSGDSADSGASSPVGSGSSQLPGGGGGSGRWGGSGHPDHSGDGADRSGTSG